MKAGKLIKLLEKHDPEENVVISEIGMNYVDVDEVDHDGEDIIILGKIERNYDI